MRVVLASLSASRRAMLTAAGVAFEAIGSRIDEEAIKPVLLARRLTPRDIADALAELKALRVSAREPDALVLGSDSVVVLADGTMLDKPIDRADAAAHLRRMVGTYHDLFSAAVVAERGRPVWRCVTRARLHVRSLSSAFIDMYLDTEWPAISNCVGCYRVEGPGVQLFKKIEGDHFTILGLPLIEVLDYLRVRGVLPS